MNAQHGAASGDPRPTRVTRDAPLSLQDEAAGYRIENAALDLFLVRSGPDGALGLRRHLFTAGPGDAVFGISPETAGDWRLIAVAGPGCRVLGLDLSKAEFDPTEDLDNWLSHLTFALIGQATLAEKHGLLAAGANVSAAPGERFISGDGVRWARLDKGRAAFMEPEQHIGTIAADVFTPLAGRAWLTVEQDSALSVLDTAGLRADGRLAASLAAFYRLLVRGISAELSDMQRQERERLAQKAHGDRQALALALSKVGAVLCPDKRLKLLAATSQDPLLDACRLVAEAAHIPLNRDIIPASTGSPASRIEALAVASGFRVRKIVLDAGWFRRDSGPLLVFRKNSGEPAAALPRGAARYDLYDPATGRVSAIKADTAGAIDGEGYMFYTPFPERPLSGRDLLAFALRGQRTDLFMILAMGAGAALLGLFTPILTATVVDTVIPQADAGMLTQIGVIILACALASAAFAAARGMALLRVEGKIDAKLQAAVTDRLLSLPAAFFKGYTAGDLASRSLSINAINSILSGVAINALLAFVFSSFNLLLLFYYDWQLALLANAFVFANLLLVTAASLLIVKKQRPLVDLQGAKQGMELAYLTGISKLRLTGSEPRAFGAWSDILAKASTLGYESGKMFNLVNAVNAAFPTLASMALFYWFFHARTEALSLGRFLSFFAAFAAFQTAMVQLISSLPGSLAAIPLYKRAQPILTAAPEVDAAKSKPKELRGEIEISHVVFRYQPEARPVLADLSIHVAPGEFVALVGDSGTGKSTVLRLLLGFETPESGAVFYDGQDIRRLDVRELRRCIGVVLQNDKPFAGSLFENIAGAASLTLDEAWEASRMVGLEEDIKAMPMGMHTLVPPGGAGFSGGQIQRLIIARALARRPKILFFDEATSALDNTTQSVVSQSVASLKVTRLVIAHRLSTVIGADRIYVLRQGKVVETGTFQELMTRKGVFYELAQRQIA
jgi:NHLM bacteriocin system ABC transporter ATP-binding protein